LQKIRPALRALGLLLVVLGLFLWAIALTTTRLPVELPPRLASPWPAIHDPWLGVIGGGVLVAAGIAVIVV
jgi:hypothetical protein